jgi:hippurate hydrolase
VGLRFRFAAIRIGCGRKGWEPKGLHMPIVNRVADLHEEITAWRRDIHENPEIGFDVHRTAGIVADKLRAFGCDEVVPGIGKTGVVGVIRGRKTASGKVVGFRADMDALPIAEMTGLPYASKTPGRMHACGHDGHTAMLLGAAKYLCETRNFDGTIVVVFQPNEEGLTGSLAMVQDGLIERFGIGEIFGMHTSPNHELGKFAICAGPMLAACDKFTIEITGKGSHAARPHEGIDTVVVAAHIITALQTIASRTIDPLDAVVVSTCMVRAGEAFNILPQSVGLTGTIRTLSATVREKTHARVRAIAEGIASAFGARAETAFEGDVPVTINDAEKTEFARGVARAIVGEGNVREMRPIMGAEDFSHMLNKRPGAFIMIGNGIGPGLHNPGYNFNDAAIPFGVSYWVRLAETAMPA